LHNFLLTAIKYIEAQLHICTSIKMLWEQIN
jgi:hypothetical protein